MKKLRLDLDALCVESFDTDASAREHGTVHANAYPVSEFDDCGFSGSTCDNSCKGSCITCNVLTDPCICDPFHPEVDFG